MACKAELGKYPMIIDINKKLLSYLSCLHDKDDNSTVNLNNLYKYQLSFTTVIKIVSTQIMFDFGATLARQLMRTVSNLM